MSFLTQYPQLKIIQSLAKKKRVSVYLVGGFLRDYLIGRSQMDFDFAVDKKAIVFARQFAKELKGAFVLLDEEHGCARVVKKFNGKPWTFDFADFRVKTLKGDINSRDFSINALYVDLSKLNEGDSLDGQIVDLTNATKDLKSKTIRMVGAKAFKDDPLRLMRAFSLQAMLGFKIESKTAAQIKKDLDRIGDVSMERVRDELFKILESPRAFAVLTAMDKIGLLEKVIPQLAVMFNVQQGGYHHLDVWKHSLEVVNQLEKILEDAKGDADLGPYLAEEIASNHSRASLMKLGALLHDIGKPDTKRIEEGRTSFHSHEHVGRRITTIIAKDLKLSVKERHMVEDLVLFHLRPGYLSNFKRPSDKSVFRYFRDTKDEAISILLLSLADQRSTRGPLTTDYDQKHHEKICTGLIKQLVAEKKKAPLVRLITGHDLIKKLKLKPSPLFAKILTSVEEGQALGKISTREEALALAVRMVQP
jgi:putative nucleotidyltransferase with HDIG domain